MNYINKNTGDQITESTYRNLNESAKINFIASEEVITTTRQIIETKSDNMSIGDAVALVAVTPLIIFKSLF